MNWILSRLFRALACASVVCLLLLQMMQLTRVGPPDERRSRPLSFLSLPDLTVTLSNSLQQQQQQQQQQQFTIMSLLVDVSKCHEEEDTNYTFGSSLEWLRADKVVNVPNLALDADFALLDNTTNAPTTTTTTMSFPSSLLSTSLQQTICIKDSSLLKPQPLNGDTSDDDDDDDDSKSSSSSTASNATTTTTTPIPVDNQAVNVWLARLVYAALTAHQYQPAWEEYRQRRRPSASTTTTTTTWCQKQQQQRQSKENEDTWQRAYNTSFTSDFECPTAKYLVVPLSGNGLGMNWNRVVFKALLTGLATHRVVVLVNNLGNDRVPPQHLMLRHPWILTSCHRRDYQCFFRPLSPCVPTLAHVQASPKLHHAQQVSLTAGVDPLPGEKLLVYDPPETNMPDLTAVKKRLHSLIQEELSHIFFAQQQPQQQQPPPPQQQQQQVTWTWQALERLNALSSLENNTVGYTVQGAMLLYFLRPLPDKRVALDKIQTALEDQFPNNTTSTMGLAVRGSDKCRKESDCMSFASYAHAAHNYWYDKFPLYNQRNGDGNHNETTTTSSSKWIPVMLTSESKGILNQGQAWNAQSTASTRTTQQNNYAWQKSPMRFFSNPHDVAQGTGFMMRTPLEQRDEIMLSSMSSFRAQLTHRLVLGNCCSNWHRLIGMALQAGCGRDPRAEFLCLQQHVDVQFRLCCAWTKTQFCQDRRAGKIPKAP